MALLCLLVLDQFLKELVRPRENKTSCNEDPFKILWFGYGAITFFASKGFYEKRARKAKAIPLDIKTSVIVCSPRRVGCMHGNEDSEGGMEIDESKGEAVYGESGGRTLFLN